MDIELYNTQKERVKPSPMVSALLYANAQCKINTAVRSLKAWRKTPS